MSMGNTGYGAFRGLRSSGPSVPAASSEFMLHTQRRLGDPNRRRRQASPNKDFDAIISPCFDMRIKKKVLTSSVKERIKIN